MVGSFWSLSLWGSQSGAKTSKSLCVQQTGFLASQTESETAKTSLESNWDSLVCFSAETPECCKTRRLSPFCYWNSTGVCMWVGVIVTRIPPEGHSSTRQPKEHFPQKQIQAQCCFILQLRQALNCFSAHWSENTKKNGNELLLRKRTRLRKHLKRFSSQPAA